MIVHVTRKKAVEVQTIAEARAVVKAQWGKSTYHRMFADPMAGLIFDGDRRMHVSYNGRVWDGHDRMVMGLVEVVA